jgi:hypothetical protein
VIRRRWYSHDKAIRRDGTPVPKNYAVPRHAYRVQHAHHALEAIVFATLRRHSTKLVGHKGKDLGEVCTLSETQIAAECTYADGSKGMPLSTCWKALRGLQRKHSIVQWNVNKATAERRRRGDHGGRTAWRIPSYTDALEARKADPDIGRTGDGKMFVIGRSRRFLTQAELDSWAINPAAVHAAGEKAMPGGSDIPEDAVTPATTTPTTAAASGPSPPPGVRARPSPAENIEPIREALANICVAGAGDDDARFVYGSARAHSAEIPIEGIAQVLHVIAHTRRKHVAGYEFTPGFFSERVLDGPVRDWVEKRRKQQQRTAKQSKWDRERRINFLIECMGAIAQAAADPNCTFDEQDLAYYRGCIAAAPPDEHAEATAAYERARDYAAGLRASRAG